MRLMTMIAAFILVPGLSQAGDWSGSNVGVQSGGVTPASGSMSNTSDGSARYGVYGGHDNIFGRLVLGNEAEFRRFDQRQIPGGVILGAVGRLNVQADRDFGRRYDPELAYAIAGGATGEAAQTHETSVVYGLGLSIAIDDHQRLSGETLRLVFDESTGSATSLESDSFSVRVAFRF